MKQFRIAAALLCLVALPAEAREVAMPAKHPTVAVSIPNSWKTDEIDFGWNAMSPGKDVFFSIESASSKTIDAMMKNNDDWMAENKIKPATPQKSEENFRGISGTVLRFDTEDDDGPTRVDFIMLPGGPDNLVMLTLWGSPKERANHQAEVESLINSIRPVP